MSPLHTFHIPVMGLAYTIDSPVKVAPLGIASVISIVEDHLIESMRDYYYGLIGEKHIPISINEKNYREKRITDYLNLVNRIVTDKFNHIKQSAFETGSEIKKYFELLPDNSAVKKLYHQFQHLTHPEEKQALENKLRESMVCGSIDVNIMTKIDKDQYDADGNCIADGSDAITALKGYAHSNLKNSSIIFSAGMNPRLFHYLENVKDFEPNADGTFNKRIAIKVSDYRSALIQGKYLAKRGIWVSEFRIESGLNCGGHAFASDGYLMGPILEEFKVNREYLVNNLFELYQNALLEKKGLQLQSPPPIKITAQGGVGTFAESNFLINHYNLNSVGWGTPFLLVPEATTVDDNTLQLLQAATKDDVILSKKSPMGVRFYFLKNTSADIERQERIHYGKPGSPCTEKLLENNTEFTTKPICTASLKYQKLKIQQLQSLNLPKEEYEKQLDEVLDKDCLCINLSNSAATKYKVPFLKKLHAVTICPGPNISAFSKVVSLQTMVDHIYGRANLITEKNRPHFFIKELSLYMSYFKEQLSQIVFADRKKEKWIADFYKQLNNGITYYKELAAHMKNFTIAEVEKFLEDIDTAVEELEQIYQKYQAKAFPVAHKLEPVSA